MDKQLSIIIPTKGRQKSLIQLLLEISEQSRSIEKTIEVIIIDDGSQPPIERYDTNVETQWLRLDKNKGAPAARKLGFEHSRGQYIHFHDSDDSIDNGWLASLLSRIDKSPNLDFLLSARIVIGENDKTIRTQGFINRFKNRPEKISERLKYNNCFGPLGGLTFSKRAVKRMRFNDLKSCQDWDMYLDAIQHDSVIIYDDSFYFIKNESFDTRISNSLNKKMLGFLKLGRIHKTTEPRSSVVRLFYIHCIARNFKNHRNKALSNFCKRHRSSIFLSFINIEFRKLINSIY